MPEVALCLSGWVGTSVTDGGLSIRRNLVGPLLDPDTFFAATFWPTDDCASSLCKDEVSRRFHALNFTRVATTPSLTLEDLTQRMEALPHWLSILQAFNSSPTHACNRTNGVAQHYKCSLHVSNNWFAPVLGNSHLHVLRQLHDISRCLHLIEDHEASTSRLGQWYTRVVHSRPEFTWLRPHPPLELMPSAFAWLPLGEDWYGGVNDRHAVLNRTAATAYMLRWESIINGDIMGISHQLARGVILNGLMLNDENLVAETLHHRGVPIRRFPGCQTLACCGGVGFSACGNMRGVCHNKLLPEPEFVTEQCLHAWPTYQNRSKFLLSVRSLAADAIRLGGTRILRVVEGKYGSELHMSFLHALASSLPGANLSLTRWSGIRITAPRVHQACFRAIFDGLELATLKLKEIPTWWNSPSRPVFGEVSAGIIWVK